jgi:DNA-binding winged helix-turn-helix (wHTH) protein/Tfp pilus assembly protein PilF
MNPREEIRFDGWTLHTATGEITRGPVRIRLQVQPQQVLEALLARPGELVTREQLIGRLWPRGIVNFDLSLNNAVRRLRAALGDNAEAPRYIETIPRRGYRFIGRVELPPGAVRDAVGVPAPAVAPGQSWRAVAAVLLLCMASVGAGSLGKVDTRQATTDRPVPRVDGGSSERLVRAEYLLHRRMPGDIERARLHLLAALAVDPDLARAWAALASAYWLDTVEGSLSPGHGLPKVREAAERALALDPDLAEAHLRLASYWCRSGDSRKGREHLAAAVAREPDHPLALGMSAGSAAMNGQFERAIELQRRAVEAEPLSLVHRGNLVAWLVMANRLDEAEAEIRRIRELHAESPGLASLLAGILVLQGRYDEALELAGVTPDEKERRFSEAIAHHGRGNHAAADAAMTALIEASDGATPGLLVAEAYAYRGNTDAAFAWLQSLPSEVLDDPSVQYSPFLRPLRADPRWHTWLKVAGRPAVVANDSSAGGLHGPAEIRDYFSLGFSA